MSIGEKAKGTTIKNEDYFIKLFEKIETSLWVTSTDSKWIGYEIKNITITSESEFEFLKLLFDDAISSVCPNGELTTATIESNRLVLLKRHDIKESEEEGLFIGFKEWIINFFNDAAKRWESPSKEDLTVGILNFACRIFGKAVPKVLKRKKSFDREHTLFLNYLKLMQIPTDEILVTQSNPESKNEDLNHVYISGSAKEIERVFSILTGYKFGKENLKSTNELAWRHFPFSRLSARE